MTHPAAAQSASLRRNAPRLLDDGSIDRPTHDAWLAAAITLAWVADNAAALRAIAAAIAPARHQRRDLTAGEVAALAAAPAVAAVMAQFPDATVTVAPLTRPAFDNSGADAEWASEAPTKSAS